MKNVLSALIILILLLSCIDAHRLKAQNIPSSSRSEEAIERVMPALKNELDEAGLKWGQEVFIRIFKKERQLELWVKQTGSASFQLFKTYKICSIGNAPLGPKLEEGDGLVPEGFYFFRPIDLNPWSDFHLSFNIGFPNKYDRDHGRTGSAIMVHGRCVSAGCFAMTNSRIEEIYALVDAAFHGGQDFIRVHVFPFRMTDSNMHRYRSHRWIDFWQNLKEGYDYFENSQNRPPNTVVTDGRYVFQ